MYSGIILNSVPYTVTMKDRACVLCVQMSNLVCVCDGYILIQFCNAAIIFPPLPLLGACRVHKLSTAKSSLSSIPAPTGVKGPSAKRRL